MQVLLGGDGGAWKIRVLDDVGDPRRRTALPDAPRQADAAGERPLAARPLEPRQRLVGSMPDAHQTQRVRLRVDGPERAPFPTEMHTDRLQDPRHRALERRRLGEDAGDRMLRE